MQSGETRLLQISRVYSKWINIIFYTSAYWSRYGNHILYSSNSDYVTQLHYSIVLRYYMFDNVVVDESIVIGQHSRSAVRRKESVAIERRAAFRSASCSIGLWSDLDRPHGRLYTYPGGLECGTVGPGDLGPVLGLFARGRYIVRPDSWLCRLHAVMLVLGLELSSRIFQVLGLVSIGLDLESVVLVQVLGLDARPCIWPCS